MVDLAPASQVNDTNKLIYSWVNAGNDGKRPGSFCQNLILISPTEKLWLGKFHFFLAWRLWQSRCCQDFQRSAVRHLMRFHRRSLVSLMSLKSFKGAAFGGWPIRKCPAVSFVGRSGEVEFRGRSGRLLRTASASARWWIILQTSECGTLLSW